MTAGAGDVLDPASLAERFHVERYRGLTPLARRSRWLIIMDTREGELYRRMEAVAIAGLHGNSKAEK